MWSALKALQVAVSPEQSTEAQLRECAGATAALLAKLSTRGGVGSPRIQEQLLPPSYLSHAQGLAFIFTAKGGLGLSYETGWGCVVQRLGKRAADGNGAPLWSGPSFVRINNVGLGLTVGYDSLETVLVLGNPRQVAPFRRSGAEFCLDGSLVLGINQEVIDEETTDSPTLRASALQQAPAPLAFAVGDGALFDLSLKGGVMSTDHRLNSAVYGADVSPSAILDGRVEPPTAFEALYAMLESLAARHQSPFARRAKSKLGRRRSTSPTSPLSSFPDLGSPATPSSSSSGASDAGGDSPAAASPKPQVVSSSLEPRCRQRQSRSCSPPTEDAAGAAANGNPAATPAQRPLQMPQQRRLSGQHQKTPPGPTAGAVDKRTS